METLQAFFTTIAERGYFFHYVKKTYTRSEKNQSTESIVWTISGNPQFRVFPMRTIPAAGNGESCLANFVKVEDTPFFPP